MIWFLIRSCAVGRWAQNQGDERHHSRIAQWLAMKVSGVSAAIIMSTRPDERQQRHLDERAEESRQPAAPRKRATGDEIQVEGEVSGGRAGLVREASMRVSNQRNIARSSNQLPRLQYQRRASASGERRLRRQSEYRDARAAVGSMDRCRPGAKVRSDRQRSNIAVISSPGGPGCLVSSGRLMHIETTTPAELARDSALHETIP